MAWGSQLVEWCKEMLLWSESLLVPPATELNWRHLLIRIPQQQLITLHLEQEEDRQCPSICPDSPEGNPTRQEFSPCWDHFKVPNRVIEVLRKTCFEANFQFYPVWHCNQNYVHQEGENSVRYSQTIDNQDTKRTSFPDQPFGLGDSWSAGKLRTFQALFSRPAEFGPYAIAQ